MKDLQKNNDFPFDYDIEKLTEAKLQGFSMFVTQRYKYHYIDNKYEEFSSDLFSCLIKEDSVVVDVGANYGYYTLLASTINKKGKTYAIEPVKENFDVLNKNIVKNGFSQIEPLNYAISDSSGEKEFNVTEASDSAGFYEHPNTKTFEKRFIQTRTLDQLFSKARVDIIKIDTEGHEIHVLNGMKKMIRSNRDMCIFIEFNPKCLKYAGASPEDLLNRIWSFGFDVYLIKEDKKSLHKISEGKNDWRNIMGDLEYANLICTKNLKQEIGILNQALQLKNQEVLSNLHKIENKEETLQRKDREIQQKKEEIRSKDQLIQLTDKELQLKKQDIEAKEKEIQLKKQDIEAKEKELRSTQSQLDLVKAGLDSVKTQLESKTSELSEIYSCRGWKLLVFFRKVIKMAFPENSIRKKSIRLGLKVASLTKKAVYTLKRDGLVMFLKKLFHRFCGLTPRVTDMRDSKNHTRPLPEEETSIRKIVYVGHDARYAGAQVLSLSILKELKENFKFSIHLILKSGGVLQGEYEKYATVYNLEESYQTIDQKRELIRSLKRKGVDNAMVSTVVSGDVANLLHEEGFKVLSMIHELAGSIKKFNWIEEAKMIAQKSDYVLFPANIVRDRFFEIVPVAAQKCRVRPQGLIRDNIYKEGKDQAKARLLLRKLLGIKEDTFVVLGVGVGTERKGVDLFVDIAEKLANKNIHFVWVGDLDSEVAEKVKGKIKKNITLVKTTPEISLYYAGADVYLMTSREEPFGTVVIESMYVGVPVIGFRDAGGFADIVTQETGVLVPYLDTKAMAKALLLLSRDKKLKDKLGETSRRLIARDFVFRDYVSYLLDILDIGPKKVSVVIPNYNYERYLKERLSSIIGQTHRPFEIIFLDDASTDGSIKLAERILNTSGIPYKIISNKVNQGCFKQWSKGINEAKGDLVWMAEADDSCDPRFLETLTAKFDDHLVGLALSQSLRMNEKGEKGDSYLSYLEDIPGSGDRWRKDYVNYGVNEISEYLSIKNTIVNASGVVMRRNLLMALEGDIGGGLAQVGDWYTYVQILRNSKIAFSATPLNYHRQHNNNIVSRSNSPSEKQAKQLVSETLKVQGYILTNFFVRYARISDALEHTRLICRNNLKKELGAVPELAESIRIFKNTNNSSKKRILFFSTNDYWGGSEIGCLKMAQGFALDGWDVALCMNRYNPFPKVLDEAITEGLITFFERVAGDHCKSEKTASFVKDFNPDIIFISQGYFFESIDLMKWCGKEGFDYVNFIPLVTEYHLGSLPDKETISQNRDLLQKSKKIFFDNYDAKKVIEKIHGVTFDSFEVVYSYGISIHQDFFWEEPRNNDPFRLVYLGRIDCLHKGLDMLLHVMAMKKWRDRSVQILAYGVGPDEGSIGEIIRREGIKNFILCGFIKDSASIFPHNHGIIFTSRMEGTPLALIEGLLCHRMAIVTPVGGMPEMITDGYNGFVAKSVSTESIDECLERAWQNRRKWKAFGINAGKSIREKVVEFPYKKCSEAIVDIIKIKK